MHRSLLFARFAALATMLIALALGPVSTSEAAPMRGSDIKTILLAAITKTAAAPAEQIDLALSMKGVPPEAAELLGNPSPDQEVTLVNLTGQRRGSDMHVTLTGALVTMLGLDAAQRLEFIDVGGKSYFHGPLPMLGAPANKWYVSDSPQQGQSFLKGLQSGMTQGFDQSKLVTTDLSFITTLKTESLHGQQCTVYGSADTRAISGAIKSLARTPMQTSDLDRISAAQIKFWICADGYLHQVWLSIDSTTAAHPTDTVGMRLRLALSDFGGSFTITAPPNPSKLEPTRPVFQTINSPGSPTAIVINGGNIRETPDMRGVVLGQVQARETVMLQKRTIDGRWYYVSAAEATGWVHASLLRVAPADAKRVFVDGLALVAAPPSEMLPAAVVVNGNRRAAPNTTAAVLGQVHEGETIQLLARTRNGAWYYARCRCGALGWVHASLLNVEPKVARKVPIA